MFDDRRLVIFDLDGTLLNTIGDLAVCCNHVLGMYGYPQYELPQYRFFVGNGIKRLIERALPEDVGSDVVEKVRASFIQYYGEHIDCNTVPYPGIPELLARLQGHGFSIAVASNKFHEGTCKLIGRFFPDIRFVAVLGQRPDVPLKPDPRVVHEIMDTAGFAGDGEHVYFVGDSGVDMDTASNAGVNPVGVSWGFRSRDELVEHGARFIADDAQGLERILSM